MWDIRYTGFAAAAAFVVVAGVGFAAEKESEENEQR